MRELCRYLPSPQLSGLVLEIATALIVGFAIGAALGLYGIWLT